MKKAGSAVSYLIALILILMISFLLPRLMPGNPLMAIYGEEALIAMTPELQAELTQRFSLDDPLGTQFVSYFKALLHGDMGYSYFHNAPVFDVIIASLPWTLLLVGLAVLISSILGVILGIESGYRRGQTTDKVLLTGLISLSGFPDFFIGILLLLFFGVALGIVPLAGAVTPYAGKAGLALLIDVLHHLALPLLALVLVRITGTYLLTRNTTLTTLGESFILTAKAKGCREREIRYKHAGRNSLLPVITAAGLQLANSITGALFIEIVFSYPGVGSLLYNSLLTRDYPLMQGILLVTTVVILLANYLIDLLYTRLDPRVTYSR
ncbi:MAG TPA: ABC transporter permease [Peptococcaceae bacterium]|nr:ABC transporter permease [Peptococcaceae bacterium]